MTPEQIENVKRDLALYGENLNLHLSVIKRSDLLLDALDAIDTLQRSDRKREELVELISIDMR